ncbi:acyl-CoA dehydrogenase family protein [Streptosporangium sp. NPDC051022]|uniref:acyl-CoA dehydrogenase family protein n=1 Tax=Streptosporangium sp. NPDC051022 TaxID=3155752 RepID=UPI00343BEAB1
MRLSAEQYALADVAGQAAGARWEPEQILRSGPPEAEAVRELWRGLDRDLGFIGFAASGEADAGTAVDLCVLAEEWGRRLLPVPLLSQAAVVIPLLSRVGSEAAAHVRDEIVAGRRIVAFAESGEFDVGRRAGSDSVVVTGDLDIVLDGRLADDLLLVADAGGGPQLVLIELDRAGVRRRRLEGLDLTRLPAAVSLNEAPGRCLGPAPRTPLGATAYACLAAELVGTAGWALDAAVEHAGQRVQFGRPVGSFQAVKHRCARMLVAVETARSLTRLAAWTIASEGETTAARQAALEAARSAATAAVSNTWDVIGVLGGIGFTWEHPAHLHYRRARAARMFFGGQRGWQHELEESLS